MLNPLPTVIADCAAVTVRAALTVSFNQYRSTAGPVGVVAVAVCCQSLGCVNVITPVCPKVVPAGLAVPSLIATVVQAEPFQYCAVITDAITFAAETVTL